MPDRVTTAWWKEERGEKLFVDFNQANRDRTMAGAYSPRALPNASVSTPLGWDELPTADPRSFTVLTIPERLAAVGDPWASFSAAPGSIDTLLGWWERDLANGLGELPFPPDFPKMPANPRACSPAGPATPDFLRCGRRSYRAGGVITPPNCNNSARGERELGEEVGAVEVDDAAKAVLLRYLSIISPS